jgi:hypothetical protein
VICLAELIGQKVPGGLEVDATNEELANAANITQFTASRLLSEWQRNRAVLKRRGKILLCSRKATPAFSLTPSFSRTSRDEHHPTCGAERYEPQKRG